MNSDNIKKFLGKKIDVQIDRPMGSRHPKFDFLYPVNYGFVPNTISGDSEEIDAYILGIKLPMTYFSGVCIAIIHRLNDDDDKLIIVPIDTPVLTDEEIKQQTHFQEQFFSSIIWR